MTFSLRNVHCEAWRISKAGVFFWSRTVGLYFRANDTPEIPFPVQWHEQNLIQPFNRKRRRHDDVIIPVIIITLINLNNESRKAPLSWTCCRRTRFERLKAAPTWRCRGSPKRPRWLQEWNENVLADNKGSIS